MVWCVYCSKVMFVLKIGSVTQSESCNIDLNGGSSQGMVLLQYSKNKVGPTNTVH